MTRSARFLRPDVQRAHRVGVKRIRPGKANTYNLLTKTIKVKAARRSSMLPAFRHEIGHAESFRNPRDRKRMGKAGRTTYNRMGGAYRGQTLYDAYHESNKRLIARNAYRHRAEMLAWKNAIRASPHGNLGADAWNMFHGYRTRVSPATHQKAVATLKRYQRFVRHVRRKK